MTEPRLIQSGDGWRVYRLGRAHCVQLDRDGEPMELWLGSDTDLARASALGRVQDENLAQVAVEAMNATW